MAKSKQRGADPGQSLADGARERARARYQRILRHPAPEFLAAWEYWSAELGITAESLNRIQDDLEISGKERIGVTSMRRWVRGESTPKVAALRSLTRTLLGPNANWVRDFIGRGLRLMEDLRFYDELETRKPPPGTEPRPAPARRRRQRRAAPRSQPG